MAQRFPRFLVVGAVGFLVDAAAFVALRAVTPDIVARIGALLVAITATWWFNRRWTFASRDPAFVSEWARYALGSVAGASVNAVVSLGVLWLAPAAGAIAAVAVGSLLGAAVNYLAASRFAFATVRPNSSL